MKQHRSRAGRNIRRQVSEGRPETGRRTPGRRAPAPWRSSRAASECQPLFKNHFPRERRSLCAYTAKRQNATDGAPNVSSRCDRGLFCRRAGNSGRVNAKPAMYRAIRARGPARLRASLHPFRSARFRRAAGCLSSGASMFPTPLPLPRRPPGMAEAFTPVCTSRSVPTGWASAASSATPPPASRTPTANASAGR